MERRFKLITIVFSILILSSCSNRGATHNSIDKGISNFSSTIADTNEVINDNESVSTTESIVGNNNRDPVRCNSIVNTVSAVSIVETDPKWTTVVENSQTHISTIIEEWFTPFLEYDWVNSEGLFFKSESIEINGPFFTINIVDLNYDNIPEVILSQKFSNRTAQINDIFVLEKAEITYKASFYGDFGECVSLYTDNKTGKIYFTTTNIIYQNQTETETISLCEYDDKFETFSCKPVISMNKKEDITIFRMYCDECILSVWSWGENENITKEITEYEYNLKKENMYDSLIIAKKSKVFESKKLVYNTFEDTEEPLYSSKSEVYDELLALLSAFAEEK